MITINLNTPLQIKTGEPVSSLIILMETYQVREDIGGLKAFTHMTMYRSLIDAIDKFDNTWLMEIPRVLQHIGVTLTANQFANVDMESVQNQVANLLEDGDGHGQWQSAWGTWGGLKALDASNSVTVTMPIIPAAAPTALTVDASIGSSQMELTWSQVVTNEFGFIVERSETGGGIDFSQVANVRFSETSYSDLGLNPSTEYFYRIASWNNAGRSTYTPEASDTTDA